jgi:hypothetical protein
VNSEWVRGRWPGVNLLVRIRFFSVENADGGTTAKRRSKKEGDGGWGEYKQFPYSVLNHLALSVAASLSS